MSNFIKIIVAILVSSSSYANQLDGFDVDSVYKLGGNVEVFEEEIILTLPKKIQFDFDSDVIDANSSVKALAAFLKNSTHPMTLIINGYTDQVGSYGYNLTLSMERAAKLKNMLIAEGVSKNTIKVFGKSMSSALVDNHDRSRKNRRLELFIIRK